MIIKVFKKGHLLATSKFSLANSVYSKSENAFSKLLDLSPSEYFRKTYLGKGNAFASLKIHLKLVPETDKVTANTKLSFKSERKPNRPSIASLKPNILNNVRKIGSFKELITKRGATKSPISTTNRSLLNKKKDTSFISSSRSLCEMKVEVSEKILPKKKKEYKISPEVEEIFAVDDIIDSIEEIRDRFDQVYNEDFLAKFSSN